MEIWKQGVEAAKQTIEAGKNTSMELLDNFMSRAPGYRPPAAINVRGMLRVTLGHVEKPLTPLIPIQTLAVGKGNVKKL